MSLTRSERNHVVVEQNFQDTKNNTISLKAPEGIRILTKLGRFDKSEITQNGEILSPEKYFIKKGKAALKGLKAKKRLLHPGKHTTKDVAKQVNENLLDGESISTILEFLKKEGMSLKNLTWFSATDLEASIQISGALRPSKMGEGMYLLGIKESAIQKKSAQTIAKQSAEQIKGCLQGGPKQKTVVAFPKLEGRDGKSKKAEKKTKKK